MLNFDANPRKKCSKNANRRRRNFEKIPAIIYGGKIEPVAIELDHNIVFNAQKNSKFFSEIITINIDGRIEKVRVKEFQQHPFKPKFTHIDFLRV